MKGPTMDPNETIDKLQANALDQAREMKRLLLEDETAGVPIVASVITQQLTTILLLRIERELLRSAARGVLDELPPTQGARLRKACELVEATNRKKGSK
jgi:hypothetical protein